MWVPLPIARTRGGRGEREVDELRTGVSKKKEKKLNKVRVELGRVDHAGGVEETLLLDEGGLPVANTSPKA